jgi:hypothetical protein
VGSLQSGGWSPRIARCRTSTERVDGQHGEAARGRVTIGGLDGGQCSAGKQDEHEVLDDEVRTQPALGSCSLTEVRELRQQTAPVLGDGGPRPVGGHEGVDEPAVLRVQHGQPFHDRDEPPPRVRVARAVQDDLPAPIELDGEGFVDQGLTGREPAVERGGSHRCSAGDFTHPHVEATFREQLPSRGEDAVAVLLRVDPEFPRQFRTHDPHFTEVDAPVH